MAAYAIHYVSLILHSPRRGRGRVKDANAILILEGGQIMEQKVIIFGKDG